MIGLIKGASDSLFGFNRAKTCSFTINNSIVVPEPSETLLVVFTGSISW